MIPVNHSTIKIPLARLSIDLNTSLRVALALSALWFALALLNSAGLVALRPRVVTITFPDGKTQKFETHASPECQIVQPIQVATVTWRALENTRGSRRGLLSTAPPALTHLLRLVQ